MSSSSGVSETPHHKVPPGGVGSWLDRNSMWVILTGIVATLLLVIPMLMIESRGDASQDPGGTVSGLQQQIDDTFTSPVHVMTVIAEARDGDILTAAPLRELLLNQVRLAAADERGELAPSDLPEQSYLYSYFDTDLNRTIDGITSLADAVDEVLASDPLLGTTLADATDEQVKVAVHRILSSPAGGGLRDGLSTQAQSERRVVNGEEIDWWTSPAVVFNVLADNARLGGGSQSIDLAVDPATANKEQFNRNVQEIIRGDEETYRAWGIAIDVGLESEEQGQVAGAFITFTVIAAVAVVGIALRSYWAVALTGLGLGALMIWLQGISALVGLKGGLINDLIVPIAMVSLGVDFAVHAVRRYQEERSIGYPPRRALAVGMTGVFGALALALASDSIAFLSNAAAGIEAVVHFGLAAAIAVTSAFIVLGVVVPVALSRIEALEPRRGRRSAIGRAGRIAGGLLAATTAGAAVILIVAVEPLIGVIVLMAGAALSLGVPVLVTWLRGRNRPEQWTSDIAADPPYERSDQGGSIIEGVASLAAYRWAVLVASLTVTAVAVYFALQLEATFDARDFFSADSDFVVSLDKLDEHVGAQGGEPATVLVEGDLSDPAALSAIAAVMARMENNQHLSRSTSGEINTSELTVLDLVEQITGSEYARGRVEATTGVTLTDNDGDGIPDTSEQLKAVLRLAVTEGIPLDENTTVYTPDRVKTMLSHDPALPPGSDVTIFSVFLPGTREQSIVAAAYDSLSANLEPLAATPSVSNYGLTGSPFSRQAQLDATTESLQTSIPIAAAAAFLLLLIAMRSVKYAFVTIVPIGLVVAWLYAIMHLSGFALNFVTATIGAVSIGVGIDYSIHMTERFREELRRAPDRMAALRQASRGTGTALIASALSSIIGFAIMGLAPMPLFATYGVLTAIMIFLALAASLLVLPSLLLIVTRDPKTADAPDHAPVSADITGVTASDTAV
ncbi:MAG: MMPL family transporter [Dehalococcoidia bacterium]